MNGEVSYCASCWCKLPDGTVAFRRLDGTLICAECFQKPETPDHVRVGMYDDGR